MSGVLQGQALLANLKHKNRNLGHSSDQLPRSARVELHGCGGLSPYLVILLVAVS